MTIERAAAKKKSCKISRSQFGSSPMTSSGCWRSGSLGACWAPFGACFAYAPQSSEPPSTGEPSGVASGESLEEKPSSIRASGRAASVNSPEGEMFRTSSQGPGKDSELWHDCESGSSDTSGSGRESEADAGEDLVELSGFDPKLVIQKLQRELVISRRQTRRMPVACPKDRKQTWPIFVWFSSWVKICAFVWPK